MPFAPSIVVGGLVSLPGATGLLGIAVALGPAPTMVLCANPSVTLSME